MFLLKFFGNPQKRNKRTTKTWELRSFCLRLW